MARNRLPSMFLKAAANDDFLEVICPSCQGSVIIYHHERNCEIFRHGVFKNNNEPIPPHSTKTEINSWLEHDLIRGCGQPFRLFGNTAVLCDFI